MLAAPPRIVYHAVTAVWGNAMNLAEVHKAKSHAKRLD
jgi:hypothetical protein